MIEKLELGAQRGPKSLAAVKAEISQTRQVVNDIEEEQLEAGLKPETSNLT